MGSYWASFTRDRIGRRRLLQGSAAAGLGLAAAGVVGCGGSDDSGGASTDSSGLIVKVQDTTKQAVKGGTYRASTNLDPIAWDPFQLESSSGGLPVDAYLTLVRAKTGHLAPAPLGEVEPNAAASWEVSGDGMQVTMKLQPNGRFDPRAPTNGRAVTAEDVVWSHKRWDTIARSKFPLSNNANPDAPLVSITAVDSKTVVLKLAFPDADIMKLLGSSLFVEPVEAEDKFNPRSEMRGSGPWMLTEYRPSSMGVYERHPYYHDQSNFFLDRVEQFIIPEYAARLAQFRSGAVWDVVPSAADLLPTKQDVPQLELYQNLAVSDAVNFVPFGWLEGSPFRDIRVRQALRLSIDGELMANTLQEVEKFRSAGLPIELFHSTPAATASHFGWWIDPKSKEFGPNAKWLEYNPAEAKKLLSAAGFPNGLETPAIIQTSAYGDNHLRANTIALGMFAEIGIKVRQEVLPLRPEWEAKIFNGRGKFVGLSFFVRGPNDTPQEMANLYLTKGSRYFGFDVNGRDPENGDPALADMIRKQKLERDHNARVAQVHDIQRYLAEKQYYVMHVPTQATGFSLNWPAVRNYRVWYGGGRHNGIWIDKTRAPLA